MKKDALGIMGEKITERFLIGRGFRILARRWRSGHTEIDLIAEDGDEVVFVEVKTRSGSRFGTPEESVTAKKRRELRLGALKYLAAEGWEERPYRIDVAAVVTEGEVPVLRYLRNAVGEN